MRTVGNLIKDARETVGISREELGELTHIKTSFIAAIEKGDWADLPDFSIVLGFVKVIAHFLELDEFQAVSLFRREYPPKLKEGDYKLENTREKKIDKKFIWGPKLTFLTGVLIIILIVLSYLGFQYRKFNSLPILAVNAPTEGQNITTTPLSVTGETDPDATVIVNNQPVIVKNDGNFTAQIDVANDTHEIDVTATSRSGKVSAIKRRIIVNLK